MDRRELEMSIQDLFEGRLQGEAFEELQEILRTDPDSRETYREYALLQHTLKHRSKGVDLLRVLPMELIVQRRTIRQMKQAVMAAAALILISALVMALFMVQSDTPSVTFETSSGTDMMLSHQVSGEELPDGQAMEPGSKLVLRNGSVELEFASGVRGVITGPAEMTLIREDLLDLTQGKGWFHVPEEAAGFQVRTKNLVVTDLGTEFGVASSSKANDEIHVFTGQVDALNRHTGGSSELLDAGQARVVSANGQLKPIDLNRKQFLNQLPESNQVSIRLDDSVTFTTSPENVMVRKSSYTFSAEDALLGFDATDSDKLVVTLSHERGQIDSVTYGGVRMTPAVNASDTGVLHAGIYYLDAPERPGKLVVNFSVAANGVAGSIIAISNTSMGAPVAVAKESTSKLRLSTPHKNCFVVAAFTTNSKSETARTSLQAPLIPLLNSPAGSCEGASAYGTISSARSIDIRFTGGDQPSVTAAVAFAPRP